MYVITIISRASLGDGRNQFNRRDGWPFRIQFGIFLGLGQQFFHKDLRTVFSQDPHVFRIGMPIIGNDSMFLKRSVCLIFCARSQGLA
ncbi:Uncharacterised protein [Mycobacteroides abscessus subsp. abscessus]|nr:Uncharacterised protein [Mycobacteroides abscessus subsp. abscessus]